MRKFAIIFSLFAFPFFLLAPQKMIGLEGDYSSQPQEQEKDDRKEQPRGEIAQGDRYENTLYERQQNQRDPYQRQQQQYYYQQSGNNNDAQYRRTRRASQFQYFNPRDE